MIEIKKTSLDHVCMRCGKVITKGSEVTFELVGVSHKKEDCKVAEKIRELEAQQAVIDAQIAKVNTA